MNNKPDSGLALQQREVPFSDRRLERAANHVALHWFPINPTVLGRIREVYVEGGYSANPEALLADLKTDFALFTFIVKELVSQAVSEGTSPTVSADPVKLMAWAGTDRIGEILTRENGLPTSHTFERSDPVLLARLRETSIVAAASDVLHNSESEEHSTGFCHGLVRQAGLNLVAWNYSSLYSRVLRSLGRASSLDAELSKELGFSPYLLAMRLLRPQLPGSGPESQSILAYWKTVDQLCEIGEALARAGSPETYPTAENDWKKANDYLTTSIGPTGIALIRERAIESTHAYRAALPSTFTSLYNFDPNQAIKSFHRGLAARENSFIRHCSPEVQSSLRGLYAQMLQSSVNKTVLEGLVKETIPLAGFTGGCVFLVDPSTMSLVPRAIIGSVTLRSLQAIPLPRTHGSHMHTLVSDVLTTSFHLTEDYARAAFDSDQPLLQRSPKSGPDARTGIYACLGRSRRVGILYLEAPEGVFEQSEMKILKVYRAVHKTLCDSLFVE
jgi:hypothetical protein